MNRESLPTIRGRHRRITGTALQRGAILLPLAMLSTASTVGLAGAGSGQSQQPAVVDVPERAVDAPASLSTPISPGGQIGNPARVVKSASANGIPSAALAAYQRGETVINAADRSCRLPWQLLAAIGSVESDHGRFGGNVLDAVGVARPGIYGVALNGRNNTALMRDTDAGRFDNDQVFDRAVGPMQFIPSTWSAVGVDADGDTLRNPQDIDDAALGSAVYLCSGSDDLATGGGRRDAVYRYNHSHQYVDLVLSIFADYSDGDYTSVPNNMTSASFFPTIPAVVPASNDGSSQDGADHISAISVPAAAALDTPNTPAPNEPSAPAQPSPPSEPSPSPTEDPQENDLGEAIEDTTETVEDTVASVLSLPQAILRCTALGYDMLTTPTEWNACITKHTGTSSS